MAGGRDSGGAVRRLFLQNRLASGQESGPIGGRLVKYLPLPVTLRPLAPEFVGLIEFPVLPGQSPPSVRRAVPAVGGKLAEGGGMGGQIIFAPDIRPAQDLPQVPAVRRPEGPVVPLQGSDVIAGQRLRGYVERPLPDIGALILGVGREVKARRITELNMLIEPLPVFANVQGSFNGLG